MLNSSKIDNDNLYIEDLICWGYTYQRERIDLVYKKPFPDIVKDEYMASKDFAYNWGVPADKIPEFATVLTKRVIAGVPVSC